MTDRSPAPGERAGYLPALAVLLILQYANLGLYYLGFAGYPVVALVIASVMVGISAILYMDLRSSLPATRLVAVLAVLFVALLCLGVAGDVAFR